MFTTPAVGIAPRTTPRLARWLLRLGLILTLLLATAPPLCRAQAKPTASATPTPTATPAPLKFIYSDCDSQGKLGLILKFSLNRPVDLSEMKQHLILTPAVPKLKLEPGNDNGFLIFADFAPETEYEIKLAAGLRDTSGNILERSIRTTLKTNRMPTHMGFDQEGKYYFPRRGKAGLSLESRGMARAMLSVSRLFPSNIAVALDGINNGNGNWDFGNSWCEELNKWKIDIKGDAARLIRTPINLPFYLTRDRRGVFSLQSQGSRTDKDSNAGEESGDSESGDQHYYDDVTHKIVVQTDLGLLAHWTDKECIVFAQDLTTVKPVSGAKVTLWSAKNQILGTGHTDGDGLLFLKDLKKAFGTPKVVVVEHKNDYTFLELKARSEDGAQIDASLSPYDREAYEAFLYADRELYRPGETAHLRWIVRKNYGDAVAKVPLLLEVTKPNGKSLLSRPIVLSELGTGSLDLPTQKSYPTGAYSVRLTVPGETKKTIGSYTFYVEEFVPLRMKAAVTTQESRWLAGQEYQIVVNGQHLFGAPAADRKAEATLALRKGDFQPAAWKQFHFGNEADFSQSRLSAGQHQTGKDGNATFKLTWRPASQVTYPLTGTITGKVYELGGRAVSAKKEITLFPSPLCLGLAAAPTGQPAEVAISVAAITSDETAASLAKLNVTLERQVWNYYVRRYYGNMEPGWSQTFQPVETREVALKGGRGEVRFKVAGDYGYYRVRVHSPATPQYSTLSFYAWGGQVEVIDAARPSLIKLTADKATYDAGQTASLRIESPFDGRALVVVQGEKFHETYATEIKKGVAQLKLKLRPDYFPGVWVEVTAVHSISKEPMLVSPFSSFAQLALPVLDRQRQLQISYPRLPKEIRPAGDTTFTIEVLDHRGKPVPRAELTLAAVDEGIHLTTGYKNPDPWAWLSRMRRPELQRAHYYDKVAYDFDKPEAGGDGEGEMGKRLAAPGENWIKPVALWSGPITTDKKGRAIVTLSIPEFSGQLRLVAVACNERAVGSQSGSIFVRRPWMLQTSQPRFLLPGDAFKCQSVLYNHAAAPCKARVTWSAGGALNVQKGASEVDLPAAGEASVFAELTAGQALGQGIVRWEVEFVTPDGKPLERIAQDVPLPVLTPAAFQSENELIVLKPGQSRELRNTKFVDNKITEIKLTVGASILMRLQDALVYVAHYPYGCVEQTTSALLPLYLLRQSTPLTAAALGKDAPQLDDYVHTGIDRLFSMQTPSGGLAYWPGASTPYAYGSVYALHCLTIIKNDRQVEVPRENFVALQRYVRASATQLGGDLNSDLYLRCYALYVLALGGDLVALRQIEAFDTIAIPRPARYLLAAALAQNTKDPDRIRKYLATAPVKEWRGRELSGTLNSDIRNSAVELMALVQTGTASPEEMARRANELVTWLTRCHYGSTQETAFIIAALSGYLSPQVRDIDKAAVSVTDPEGKEKQLKGAQVYEGTTRGPGRVYKVVNSGPTDVYLNLTTRGIPLKPETAVIAKGLSVSRTFIGDSTTTATTLALKQTDSPIVRLTITCDQNIVAQNVIVADLLPAGLEIENPRLNPDAIPSKVLTDAITPSHLEVRDDRLVLAFDEITPGTHHFYYLVRAVTPGKYQYPPLEAECMYDATLRARSAPGTLEVTKDGAATK